MLAMACSCSNVTRLHFGNAMPLGFPTSHSHKLCSLELSPFFKTGDRLSLGPSSRRGQLHSGRRMAAQASLRDAQELVQSGVVISVAPSDANQLLSDEDYKVLDVRPIWEKEKSFVTGSSHVPLFIEDEDTGFMTLLKKGIQMGYGGMWMGQRLTTRNEHFLQQVQTIFPSKDEKLLLVCGEGLRSLLALDELHENGYINLAWLEGGFSKVQDGNFPDVQGSTKLQFATVGGAAELLVRALLFIQGSINSLASTKSTAENSQ